MTQSCCGPSLTTIHQDAHRGKMAISRKKAGNWLWPDKLQSMLWFVSVSYKPYLGKGKFRGFFGCGGVIGKYVESVSKAEVGNHPARRVTSGFRS